MPDSTVPTIDTGQDSAIPPKPSTVKLPVAVTEVPFVGDEIVPALAGPAAMFKAEIANRHFTKRSFIELALQNTRGILSSRLKQYIKQIELDSFGYLFSKSMRGEPVYDRQTRGEFPWS